MAITLRTITGSALSYEQLDTNFSSFFYSASYAGGTITLFTTGSDDTGSAVPTPASMSQLSHNGQGVQEFQLQIVRFK